MQPPKAFIFDLDGVLTDTAHYHYLAWKALADQLGLAFDKKINERLKGVSRIRSLEIILEENKAIDRYTALEKEALADAKNGMYVKSIEHITEADILPGVVDFLKAAKEKSILLAVASASKNAFAVLERLGIKNLFDYIADARLIKHAKPHPEVFLNCSEYLKVEADDCIGFEDAEAGIEAIHSAGMHSIGIGVQSNSVCPHLKLNTTSELSIESVLESYYKK